jgi:carbon-monoxide dehydrogenase large subunit
VAERTTGAYVGQGLLRREDEYLLRGQGHFVDDLPEPRDTIFLGFVMSPHAHARIVAIDASEAKALPGVIDVLTGEDLAKLTRPVTTEIEFPGYIRHGRDVLARSKVRFVGEHVAVVLAESAYAAHDAIELVKVEFDPLPVAADLETAHLPGAPQVHDHIPNNTIFAGAFQTKDFDANWAAGEQSLRERFRTGRVAGIPIEPRGCLALPSHVGDSLVFYSSTQVPHLLRTALAMHIVGASESKIRVVVPEVGGGFGTKAQIYTEEVVAAALALKLRRPMKWIQDRREELLTSIHARDHVYDVEAKFTREGVITALRLELYTNAGAYSSLPFGCTLEPTGGARMLVGPYRVRHYAYRNYSIATHTCPSGAYRGVAQPTCFMAIEGMMDRIARKLGLDPAEVRLRNMIRPEEMPWVNAVGVRYDTGSYVESLERAIERIGYKAFRARQPANRMLDGKLRGVGICCFTEVSGTGAPGWRARGLTRLPGFDSALIKVEPTGKVTAYISHANGGQGHYTTFAQLVADSTGADMADVTIVEGDTGSTPYGTNTFASRSAVTGGGAVIRAGRKVMDKMRRIAAEMLEVAPEDVVIERGTASVAGVPNMRLNFTQIAETAYSMNNHALPQGEEYGLEATDFYDPPLVTMANAVHICTVAVDPDDARVKIEDYVVVHDCGRIINPVVVDGQVQGGSTQGLGEALMEELVYDSSGQLLNANLLDYLLPTAEDVPDYRIYHIESPTIDAEGGFKGVGEGGVIGAVPAIVNAVADALAGMGANVNRIPLRPSYLLGLMSGG